MQVLIHPIPAKYLDRLNADDRERVKTAFKGLEKEPPEGDIRPVAGKKGYFRGKVGSYRALCRIKDNAVFVTHIEPRGQAHTKKTKKDRGKMTAAVLRQKLQGYPLCRSAILPC